MSTWDDSVFLFFHGHNTHTYTGGQSDNGFLFEEKKKKSKTHRAERLKWKAGIDGILGLG